MNTIQLVLYPMSRILPLFIFFNLLSNFSFGQQAAYDLRQDWLLFEAGEYAAHDLDEIRNTIYFKLEPAKYLGGQLQIESARPYFLFVNGKLSGEYTGLTSFSIDSLSNRYSSNQLMACVYQESINPRELKTSVTKATHQANTLTPAFRPSSHFKDFVIASGLTIIIFFLVVSQINPKLASDYFSIIKIFSPREADDAQSNARLTSSNNFQFYVGCSLLLAFYLLIILYHLPDAYALPLRFQASGFWSIVWQWIRLAFLILGLLMLKIVIVFMLTRLFNMRGLARVHFFNWVRLMLIVIGGATIIVFSYYVMRGQNESIFVAFLSLIVATLIAWIFIIFMKLNGKTEHSMFHLFSYICATELIPLLITIKVLFQ